MEGGGRGREDGGWRERGRAMDRGGKGRALYKDGERVEIGRMGRGISLCFVFVISLFVIITLTFLIMLLVIIQTII